MSALYSPRLTLRPWRLSDAAFAFDLYSRPEVTKLLGAGARAIESQDRATALLMRLMAFEHPKMGYWAVENAEGLVGTVLLQEIRTSSGYEPQGDTEIGWHFHPDAWGNGYASEAAARLLEHGISSGMPYIHAVVDPRNYASMRVCERIGMEPRGVTDRYYDHEYELFTVSR